MRKFKFLQTYNRLIRTHWFSVALLIMLLMAIVKQKTTQRHNNNHKPVITNPIEAEKEQPEKFTEEAAPNTSKSVYGIFSSPSGKCVLPKISEGEATQFIKRFGRVAMAEQKKYGIPASVLLATAYVNSFAGTRDCAKNANNYFALSCEAVKGKTYDESGRCKVKLKTAWEGFRTFSMYLDIQPWLAEAKNTAGRDPDLWLEVFEKTGLSDVEGFLKNAKEIVHQFNLETLDMP